MAIDPGVMAETKSRLHRASEDLRAAEHDMLASPPLYEYVVFHCERAVERALKAFLVWHDRPFRKTHDLEDLGRRCVEVDASVQALVDSVMPLADYASEQGQSGGPGQPTRKETEKALLIARRALEVVFSYLPPQVRPPQMRTPVVQPQQVQPQENPPGESAADDLGKDDGEGSHHGTGVPQTAKAPNFLVVPIHRHRSRSSSRSRSKSGDSSERADPVYRALRRPRTRNILSYRSKRFWTWVSLAVLCDVVQFLMNPPQVAWKAILSLTSGMVAFGSLFALPMVLIALKKDWRRSVTVRVALAVLYLVWLPAMACAAGFLMWWTYTHAGR